MKININYALLDPVFLFIMFTDQWFTIPFCLSNLSTSLVSIFLFCVILDLQSDPCWPPAWHSVAFDMVAVLVIHFVAMGKYPRKVTEGRGGLSWLIVQNTANRGEEVMAARA